MSARHGLRQTSDSSDDAVRIGAPHEGLRIIVGFGALMPLAIAILVCVVVATATRLVASVVG